MPAGSDLVSLGAIREAAVALVPFLRPTPVEEVTSLSALCSRSILLKPEHRQATGSFKIRGAANLIRTLPTGVEVVAASAGNHAQGVARAARLTGHPARVLMPRTASLPKIEATRADDAIVQLVDGGVDDAIAAARRYAEETGAMLIHPFDDPAIIAGQGTIGLEFLAEAPDVETIVVPVGGGGLIAGIAAAVRAVAPAVRIIGVEAVGAAGMRAALDAGRPVELPSTQTIADGIAVRAVSERTLAHCAALVDEVVSVSDDDIARALLLLLERAKAVVEPAGAAGFAAVLSGAVAGRGPVGVICSGGNVDPIMLSRLVEHGLTAAGRYLVLRVVLDDRPGALAHLTSAIAAFELNVHSVEHHRIGLRLGVDQVEVLLTVETRDPEHRDETVRGLRAQGFQVELVS